MLAVRIGMGLTLLGLFGCSDAISDLPPEDAGETQGDSPASETYRLRVRGKFEADAMGARFFAQNLAEVHIPAADIAGADYLWVVTAGGETIANADAITAGAAKVEDDLSFEITTDAIFSEAPYELAIVVLTSGKMNPPQEGDLASFSFQGIEEGDPPATGVSIRFNVHDEDVEIDLSNNDFIRF